jgi:hypothetical protein
VKRLGCLKSHTRDKGLSVTSYLGTPFHFITGHAFTGEFTQRFYPHTQDHMTCPCGTPCKP